MPTITIFTFEGVASKTGKYDPARNPLGGFATELAMRLVAADPATWAWTPILYSPDAVLSRQEPFGAAIARGVAEATQKILATPGKIVLAAHAQGTLLTTTLYNEIRYGNLKSRRDDLVGIVTFGDATRPTGWTVPLYGGRDPGGAGTNTQPLRQSYGQSNTGLVNAPEPLYWTFANFGDAAACTPSGMQTIMAQVLRRIMYSGTESPDTLIFNYGVNGQPNQPPTTPVPVAELGPWCATNTQTAQALGTYRGQSLLDLIIALVGNSSVISVRGVITQLTQWWPFMTGPWSFIQLGNPPAINPHARYSGLYPYTGVQNSTKTAVGWAYDHLLGLSKAYLPSAAPNTVSKADRPFQFYTFGTPGQFYNANGSRTTVGLDGCTADIGRADIDYDQTGYGADIARGLDPGRVEWVPISYASTAFPLRMSVQAAVDRAVRIIAATPPNTQFFLAGGGIGAQVSGRIIQEFRDGRLSARATKLLGAYHYGNPTRQTGIYRAVINPGGHGIAGAGYRMTDTDPTIVWEFARPEDPVAIIPEDQRSAWAAAVFASIYQNPGTPSGLKPQISESVLRPYDSDPDLVAQTLAILNGLFGPTGTHNDYTSYFPFANTKSSVQLAIDNINAIVGVSRPTGSETETTGASGASGGVIVPAPRRTLMNTRTYMNVPDAAYLPTEDRQRVYAGIKKVNIDYIRIPVEWNLIQSTRNLVTPDRWSDTDAAINQALAANLQPMVVIAPPFPSWTSPAKAAIDVVPFVTELVGRYMPGGAGITVANRGVMEYQIWDGQNAAENWPTRVDPAQYVAMLMSAYPKIKEVYPDATVIFGGLQSCNTSFPAGSAKPVNVDAVTYLRDCYQRGIRGCFDVMAYHPLSMGTRQIPRPAAPNARTIAEADRVRGVMSTYGDGDVPMYWTAVGYDTTQVTPLQQREYLTQFRWWTQTRPWVTGIGIYAYRDSIVTRIT